CCGRLGMFSHCIEPKELVGGAFLRRMWHKVEINAPERDIFEKIFANMVKKLGMNPGPEAVDYLYERYYTRGRPTRASDARDLLETVVSICRFRRIPVQLTRQLMVDAGESFIREFK